jgi:hypothetical protein
MLMFRSLYMSDHSDGNLVRTTASRQTLRTHSEPQEEGKTMRARQTSTKRDHGPGSIPTAIALLILVLVLYGVAGVIGRNGRAAAAAKTECCVETATAQINDTIGRYVATMEGEIRCRAIAQTAGK